MTEMYVEGGVANIVPADYWGVVHCADCQWHSEHRMNHDDLTKVLSRRLADHRRTAHPDGEVAP